MLDASMFAGADAMAPADATTTTTTTTTTGGGGGGESSSGANKKPRGFRVGYGRDEGDDADRVTGEAAATAPAP
eukprot:1578-Pelagococcus_subviridis.AAC.1